MAKKVACLITLGIFLYGGEQPVGVRDVLIKNKFEPVALSDTSTELFYRSPFIPSSITVAGSWCKEVGGDNLYVIDKKDNSEIPLYKENGEPNDDVQLGLKSLFKSIGGLNKFDSAKPFPWVCKKQGKALFYITREVYTIPDGIGGRDAMNYYVLAHNPEKQTSFKQATIKERFAVDGDVKTTVAKKTSHFKSSFEYKDGDNDYIGSYNGVDSKSKCDLISVEERISAFKSSANFNYKVCKSGVYFLGGTPQINLSSNVENAIVRMAKTCQQSGSAVGGADDYMLSCKLQKEQAHCSVEISILNSSNQLVGKRNLDCK